MKEIKGEVTQEDIRLADSFRGTSLASQHCVVATALRRMLPEVKKIEVGFTLAIIAGEHYQVDEGSAKEIYNWTFKKTISPFSFTLTPKEY